MTKTVVKSARKAALHAAFEALVPLSVLVCFGLIWWLTDDLPMIVEIVCLLAMGFGALLTAKAIFDVVRIANSNGEWRVELSETELKWSSALPQKFPTIVLPLKDIASAQRVRRVDTVGESMDEIEFSLNVTNGDRIKIPLIAGMIDPDEVFRALAGEGVDYTKVQESMAHGQCIETKPDPLK